MKLTVYPLAPFDIQQPGLTVIEAAHPLTYQQLVLGCTQMADSVTMSNDNGLILDIGKATIWLGEIATADITRIFLKRMTNTLISSFQDNPKSGETLDLIRQIGTNFQSVIDEHGWPMKVDPAVSLTAICKLLDIKIDLPQPNDIAGKMRSIIELVKETNPEATLIMANLSHYYLPNQIEQLGCDLFSNNIASVVIEFSESRRERLFHNCRYYHIDQDFEVWQQLNYEP